MNTEEAMPDQTEICKALPQVALDFMNTVHCEEVLLVQCLLQALESNLENAKIDSLLNEWVAHTVAHFAREERLMEEYRFPPFGIHQHEHELAMEALLGAQSNWLTIRDGSALEAYIEHDWRTWLNQHISTMDMVTARFLAQFDIQVDLDLD